MARTTVSAFIWAFAVLAILGIFSINLGPLIAGAGIAGIAVGLGAQQLVKDCIAGFFILLEDQCGVGDEIDIGPAIGTVESITLRATTLRDGAGTVWTVPNGTVLRIGNKSRDWSQGTVDVTVADAAQLDDAVAVIERVAGEVSALPEVAPPCSNRLPCPAWRAWAPTERSCASPCTPPPGEQAPGDAHAARRPHPRAQRRRHRLGLLVLSTSRNLSGCSANNSPRHHRTRRRRPRRRSSPQATRLILTAATTRPSRPGRGRCGRPSPR